MIHIDALSMLFLLEFTALCVVATAVLFFRNRKHKLLYRSVLRDMMNLKAGAAGEKPVLHPDHAGLKKEGADTDAKMAQILHEKELLTKQVVELEAKLAEENKLLVDLQKKHSTLENEYSILYGKHFEGQQKNDPV